MAKSTEVTFDSLMQGPDVNTIGVVGSREWPDREFVFDTIMSYVVKYDVDTLVSGGQPEGVDGWASAYAHKNDLEIIEHLPAHWLPEDDPDYKPYHVSNFFERNTEIVKSSDLLLAFCYQGSNGTMDTYKKAKARLGERAILFTEDDL